MNKFFHKIKNVGRIVFISVLAIMLFVGCGNDDKENKPNNSQTESQQESQADKNSETETGTEDGTENGTEIGTDKNTEDGTDVGKDDTEVGNNGNQGNADTTKPSEGNNEQSSTQQQQNATKPNGEEILGSGTVSDPYIDTPIVEGNGLVTNTVTISAGKSVYYGIYRVGGMILTINDANAYVVCNDTRYEAVNGVVTFTVPDAMANETVSFEIGNKGGANASFKIVFSNVAGSYMNPTVINNLESRSISLEKGNETGHYYKYIAEKTGTIRFYISATPKDGDIKVTNNNTMAQRSFDGDDSGTGYIELKVTAGDEIMIQAIAMPDRRNNFPATTITWYGQYQ